MHDADPLAEVAAAWIDRWDGTSWDDDAAMVPALRGLRAGRWWPDLDRMLAELDRRMPDRFVSGAAAGTDLV